MKKIHGLAVVFASAVIVSGCVSSSSSSSSGGYSSDLNRKTAGAAVISSFAKMCGARRVDQYRDSFVAKMKAERGISAETEAVVRSKFVQADSMIGEQFPTAADRKAYCASRPSNQDLIDRGIAGDFSGQI